MSTLERNDVRLKRIHASNYSVTKGNSLCYDFWLNKDQFPVKFQKPSNYHFGKNPEKNKLIFMKQASTLNDIHSDKSHPKIYTPIFYIMNNINIQQRMVIQWKLIKFLIVMIVTNMKS